MTIFYLKSDSGKDKYFEIDRAKEYTVNIPDALCQKFFYPISETLKLNSTNPDFISYFIGIDTSFSLNEEKTSVLIQDLKKIKNYLKQNINTLDLLEIYNYRDLLFEALIQSGWQYSGYFTNNFSKTNFVDFLSKLIEDIINIAIKSISNKENLCCITM